MDLAAQKKEKNMKLNREDFGYVEKNGVLAFQKGPLSQWYGAYKGQDGGSFYNQKLRINCCEQYMMLGKAALMKDSLSFEQIRHSCDPKEQKDLGRQIKNFDPKKWDEKKFDIVCKGNLLKFSQNIDERNFLVDTGDLILVEAAPWDKIWGCGTGFDDETTFDPLKWQGENLLGKALMKVRKTLKEYGY